MDVRESSAKATLVSVPTEQLRDRLNRLYSAVRGHHNLSVVGRFDYLWDLKELAMLEGRRHVEIPDAWLDELERLYVEAQVSGRGH